MSLNSIIGAATSGLYAAQTQLRVVSDNIANVDTPGYRARDIDFGGALRDAFAAADEGREVRTAVAPVEDATAPAKADGNTVDLDYEMTKLGANGGDYVSLARILQRRLAALRDAIEGR